MNNVLITGANYTVKDMCLDSWNYALHILKK